ncbi:unnamed protein product [Prunus brigantina]
MMSSTHSSGNSNAYANAVGLASFSIPSINSMFTKPWILDSGATDHITYDPTLFTKTESSQMPIVNLPTGSHAPITSTGTIPFNSNITLDKVLCVPSFRLNLMSASKLTTSLNCCAILFPTFCVLQDLATGKMIGSGKQRGGLYYMSLLQKTLVSYQVSLSSDLWHMRLGHQSPARLRLASSSLSFDNNCSVCPMAKQTRLPFPLSSISTKAPFDLLHCDIWGPHKVTTHSGARCFLTTVDDFTSWTLPIDPPNPPANPPNPPTNPPQVPNHSILSDAHDELDSPTSPIPPLSPSVDPTLPHTDNPIPLIPPPRQSTRSKHPPAWYTDYHMSNHINHSTSAPRSASGTRYPFSYFLTYTRLSSAHCAFLANITGHTEPTSYA